MATLKGLLHDEGHGGEWPGFAEACHSGKDQESCCVLVAEQEGSVAGMAILAPRQSIWEGQRLFLRMLLTRRDRRRCGVATALMEAVMGTSRQLAVEAVEWKLDPANEAAAAFFGFFGGTSDQEWVDYEWPVAVGSEFGRDGFVPRVPVKLELGSGFGRDGFVPRVPVLTEAEAVSFREQLERWEASLPGGKITGNQRFKTHLLLPLCARLVRHPALLAVAESLLGPNVLVWSSDFNIKEPGSEQFFSWHQDPEPEPSHDPYPDGMGAGLDLRGAGST